MANVSASNSDDYLVQEKPKSKPSTTYNAKTTTPTGFMEFKPRDMETQVKYDAMSPSWEGVDSSMKAVERGDYALDSAETTTREKRPQYAPGDLPPPPTQTSESPLATVQSFLDRQPKTTQLLPPVGTCVIQ